MNARTDRVGVVGLRSREDRRSWIGPEAVRWALIGALPVLILVVSPQRTALSVVAGGLYLAVALALARPTRAERPLLLYAIAVAGFIALAMARADLILDSSIVHGESA